MNKKFIQLTIFAIISLFMFITYTFQSVNAENGHEDHNHEVDASTAPHEDSDLHENHADHESDHDHESQIPQSDRHSEDDGHEHHEHQEHQSKVVTIPADKAKLADIEIAKVVEGSISRKIELPGEVSLNEDNVAHMVPRFPGIAKEIRKNLGDRVQKGDILAIIESNESLSNYSIISLISGTVIDKHVTLGEFVSEESSIYTVADLSRVWVNFAVYAKDTGNVHRGQKVLIEQLNSPHTVNGKISYISPYYDRASRSMIARAIISNHENRWKPGTFVKGIIDIKSEETSAVVTKNAVQTLDNQSVVFVPGTQENEYYPVPVTTGMSDGRFIIIHDGLDVGDHYVSHGAFAIKAKIVTSTLDSHAGHGH